MTQVPGRVPTILGAQEMRWPPKSILIPAGRPVALPDTEAVAVLERHGREGILEVLDGIDPVDVLLEAKAKRMDHLVRFINTFRETNAVRQANGGDITMPRMIHREALREIKVLRDELAGDELLMASVPEIKPEKIEDVAAAELRAFGIEPEAAPLVPRMRGLSGIEV